MKKFILVVCFFLFGSSGLFAEKKIELFHNWVPDPANQSVFELPPGVSWNDPELPLFCHLKKSLAKKNYQITCIDLKQYRDHLKRPKRKKIFRELKEKISHFFSPPKIAEDVDAIVFWNVNHKVLQWDLSRLPKEKMILFIWEPPTQFSCLYEESFQRCFSRIYTWDDRLVDNQRFFKFYYPNLRPMLQEIPDFKEKKLCTLISSNIHSSHPDELYSSREEVIRFFEDKEPSDFEFYGKKWELCGYKNYRGTIPDKLSVLKNYRFCICYENMKNVHGYITEKIFDCFAAGCVPVYLGASNVDQFIPPSCFIDRRQFQSLEELYHFLKMMPEEEYNHYLENIRQFLKSDQAKRFSQDEFMKIFIDAVEAL